MRGVRYDQQCLVGRDHGIEPISELAVDPFFTVLPLLERPRWDPPSDFANRAGLDDDESRKFESIDWTNEVRRVGIRIGTAGGCPLSEATMRELWHENGTSAAQRLLDYVCVCLWESRRERHSPPGMAAFAGETPGCLLFPRNGTGSPLALRDVEEMCSHLSGGPGLRYLVANPRALGERQSVAGVQTVGCPHISLDEGEQGTTSAYLIRVAAEDDDWQSPSGVARLHFEGRTAIRASAVEIENEEPLIEASDVTWDVGFAKGPPASVVRLMGIRP